MNVEGLAFTEPPKEKDPFWVPSFTELVSVCTSVAMTGCALAWIFVHVGAGQVSSRIKGLFFMMFNSTSWPRACRKRMALPVRLGELKRLRDRLLWVLICLGLGTYFYSGILRRVLDHVGLLCM